MIHSSIGLAVWTLDSDWCNFFESLYFKWVYEGVSAEKHKKSTEPHILWVVSCHCIHLSLRSKLKPMHVLIIAQKYVYERWILPKNVDCSQLHKCGYFMLCLLILKVFLTAPIDTNVVRMWWDSVLIKSHQNIEFLVLKKQSQLFMDICWIPVAAIHKILYVNRCGWLNL